VSHSSTGLQAFEVSGVADTGPTVSRCAVGARIDTTLNPVTANVTSGRFEPLAEGEWVGLVALTDTVSMPNVAPAIVGTNSPVSGGETLTVSAGLENPKTLPVVRRSRFRWTGHEDGTSHPRRNHDRRPLVGDRRRRRRHLHCNRRDARDTATADVSATSSADGPGPLARGLGTPTDPDGRYEDVTGDRST